MRTRGAWSFNGLIDAKLDLTLDGSANEAIGFIKDQIADDAVWRKIISYAGSLVATGNAVKRAIAIPCDPQWYDCPGS